MRYVKILLFVGALFASSAYGQTSYPREISLSWTNADSYEDTVLTDGTVIPGGLIDAGDLTDVRIECFRQSETAPVFVATVPVTGEGQPQAETFEAAIPRPGTYTCFGYSILFNAVESVASDPSSPKKFTGKPLPPQTFR